MFALCTVSDWDTKHPGNRLSHVYLNSYFLNTKNMVNIVAYGTDDSSFLFSNNPRDRRDSPDTIRCSLTPAMLEIYRNTDTISKFATLDVFPNSDITNLGTAEETLIEWDDISYFYITQNDWDAGRLHMVYYTEAWKRVEKVIDHSWIELLVLLYL